MDEFLVGALLVLVSIATPVVIENLRTELRRKRRALVEAWLGNSASPLDSRDALEALLQRDGEPRTGLARWLSPTTFGILTGGTVSLAYGAASGLLRDTWAIPVLSATLTYIACLALISAELAAHRLSLEAYSLSFLRTFASFLAGAAIVSVPLRIPPALEGAWILTGGLVSALIAWLATEALGQGFRDFDPATLPSGDQEKVRRQPRLGMVERLWFRPNPTIHDLADANPFVLAIDRRVSVLAAIESIASAQLHLVTSAPEREALARLGVHTILDLRRAAQRDDAYQFAEALRPGEGGQAASSPGEPREFVLLRTETLRTLRLARLADRLRAQETPAPAPALSVEGELGLIVREAVRGALSGPPLIRYSGRLLATAQWPKSGDSGDVVVRARLTTLWSEAKDDEAAAGINVNDGIDGTTAMFLVECDTDTPQGKIAQEGVAAPTVGTTPVVTFRLPVGPQTKSVWLQVSQRDRTIQTLRLERSPKTTP